MFAGTIERFDEYYRAMDKAGVAGFNRDLGCEVRERLQQLDYIIKRVRHLEQVCEQAMARSRNAFHQHVDDVTKRGIPYESVPLPEGSKTSPQEFQVHQTAYFELKLLTEAFYYLAGRVRTIVRNKSGPLPNLNTFECEGVRNVRNKLLEHAEGSDSQISIQSFGFGKQNGPVIKAVRQTGTEHIFPDGGLYKNAEEFRDNLESAIYSALA